MKHLTDIVSYDEAIKLRDCGCNIEISKMYKVDSNHKDVKLVNMITQRDWNHLCHRTISAPTYAEVIDWLMDKGCDLSHLLSLLSAQLKSLK